MEKSTFEAHIHPNRVSKQNNIFYKKNTNLVSINDVDDRGEFALILAFGDIDHTANFYHTFVDHGLKQKVSQ